MSEDERRPTHAAASDSRRGILHGVVVSAPSTRDVNRSRSRNPERAFLRRCALRYIGERGSVVQPNPELGAYPESTR